MRDRPLPQIYPKKHIWLYRMITAALDVTGISARSGVSNAFVSLQVAGMSRKVGFTIPTHLKR